MWTTEKRQRHDQCFRHPGDLTNIEWALVAPLIPPAKSGGRMPTVNMPEVVTA